MTKKIFDKTQRKNLLEAAGTEAENQEEAEEPTAQGPAVDDADFPKTVKLLMRFAAKGNEQRAKKTMALVSAHLAKMAQGLGAENEAKMLMKIWKRLRAG